MKKKSGFLGLFERGDDKNKVTTEKCFKILFYNGR